MYPPLAARCPAAGVPRGGDLRQGERGGVVGGGLEDGGGDLGERRRLHLGENDRVGRGGLVIGRSDGSSPIGEQLSEDVRAESGGIRRAHVGPRLLQALVDLEAAQRSDVELTQVDL